MSPHFGNPPAAASSRTAASQSGAKPGNHDSPPTIKHFGAKSAKSPGPVVTPSKPPLQDHAPPSRAHPECRKPCQQRFLHCLEEIKEAETTRAALPLRLSSVPSSPAVAGYDQGALNTSPGGASCRSLSPSSSPATEFATKLSISRPAGDVTWSAEPSPSFRCSSSVHVATSPSARYGYPESLPFRRSTTSPASSPGLSPGNSQSLISSESSYLAPAPPPAPLAPTFSLPTYASYTASNPSSSVCPSAFPASHASQPSRSPSSSSATSFPSSLSHDPSFLASSSHPSAPSSSDGEDLGPSACPYQASLFSAYAPFSASVNGAVNVGEVNAGVNAARQPALERTRSGGAGAQGNGRGNTGSSGNGPFSGVADDGAAAGAPRICSRELLTTIVTTHDIFARDMTPNGSQVADYLLSQLLHLTQSTAGCISSALPRSSKDPSLFLRTHSITNFAWTPYLKAWYAENAASGLVFSNQRTLMARVVNTADVIVSNDVASDPRGAGLPPGHPPMTTFLGVPLFSGSRLVGMFAVTNRVGGYSEAMVTELHALTKTVGQVVTGIQQRRQRWEREERLNAVLEGTCQAVLAVAPSGRLSCVNRAARGVFGVPDQAAARQASSAGVAAGAGGRGAAAAAAAAVGNGVTSSSGQPLASLCDFDLLLSDLIESIDGNTEFLERDWLERYAESGESFPAIGLYHGEGNSCNHRSSQGTTHRDTSAAAVRMNLHVRVTRGETPQVAHVLTVQAANEVEGAAARGTHALSDRHCMYGQVACSRAEGDWRRAAAGNGVGGGEEGEGGEDVRECQLLMSDEDGTLTIVV
ncbi:hypothetical protein CLOM_g23028 [Closterium sp. NIES-68]|nr:hypothetical protein CLOM_g23028 [Closterium sp. NIES-68]GJP73332.1 hypothetical protein CLOP_g4061 [Closterium sp. NIES-67]